jgi:hypothetical protein
MTTMIKAADVRLIQKGILVQRAATTLVQNTQTSLFTITGGDVYVNLLYGKVTTAPAATGSLTAKLVFTPTGGAAADIAAATVITSDAIGTFYSITGVATDLLSAQQVTGTEIPTVTFTKAFPSGTGIVLPAGILAVTVSNHDPGTGAVKWNLCYTPIDAAASVATS